MRILLTGSTGFIGSALQKDLIKQGHQVFPLLRGVRAHGSAWWNSVSGHIDVSAAEPLDAVIHLAGESIAQGRWTRAKKIRIRDSRTQGTRVLCKALAYLGHPPSVLISASAVGFYGNQGDSMVTEDSPPGQGFLAEVCQEWEQATEDARQVGIRVVHTRFGVVLSRKGGMLSRILRPFRLGLGGILGDGTQYISWITLTDCIGAIQHLLTHEDMAGPVNVATPRPVTNREFTVTLGRILHRPTLFRIPAVALRCAFGELAEEVLLSSVRALPGRLTSSGFEFQYPDLLGALRKVLESHQLFKETYSYELIDPDL